MVRIIEMPSPNFNERPDGVQPDMIVIHYTGMETAEAALERLCNPDPDQHFGRVSAHYTIDLNGDVYAHVHPDQRAWHAGVSEWKCTDGCTRTGLNDYSIGIELVNKGHEFGYHEFPNEQIDALIKLMRELRTEYNIPLEHIVGHEDIAPTRKQDPGDLFPWQRLVDEKLAHSDRLKVNKS
jgi:N-acetylmuramoyl-L-alanine amidase